MFFKNCVLFKVLILSSFNVIVIVLLFFNFEIMSISFDLVFHLD